jgi:hypothetical protein
VVGWSISQEHALLASNRLGIFYSTSILFLFVFIFFMLMIPMYSYEFDFIQILLVQCLARLSCQPGLQMWRPRAGDSPHSIPLGILRLLAFAYISIFPFLLSYL